MLRVRSGQLTRLPERLVAVMLGLVGQTGHPAPTGGHSGEPMDDLQSFLAQFLQDATAAEVHIQPGGRATLRAGQWGTELAPTPVEELQEWVVTHLPRVDPEPVTVTACWQGCFVTITRPPLGWTIAVRRAGADMLSPAQAGVVLGVTAMRVRAMIAQGRLEAVRTAQGWHIPYIEVERVRTRRWGRPPKKPPEDP